MRSCLFVLLTFWQPALCQRPYGARHGELRTDGISSEALSMRSLKGHSPEAEALLKVRLMRERELATQRWTHWTSQSEVFTRLWAARKFGPHWAVDTSVVPTVHHRSGHEGLALMFWGQASVEWCFVGVALGLLLLIDAVLLQNLPESRRAHVSVLFIWMAIALACCVEVWVCAGTTAGISWLSGYLLELLYSAEHVVVMQLVFSSLDTPHRLMGKALYLAMIGTMAFRFIGFLSFAHGINPVASRAGCWMLGTVLLYAGISRLSSPASNDGVSESAVVRLLRGCFGDRLGEFYDEEGEALLVEAKGKVRLTLLGVVLICLVVLNVGLNFDVVLAKSEATPDAFINFSSSALALFAIRSLFFVVRDFFNLSNLTRSTFAVVLLLMGFEMLGGRAVFVSALVSVAVFVCMLVLSVGISSLHHPNVKTPSSDLHSF
ncbi:alx [Symbiodinium natans]|uniref:Alx protein n=1 Tax=Symbiodinium natans TaxID=878477 RepID=A0A812UG21_9DINO|nr:alx [Symbiodinium natans]